MNPDRQQIARWHRAALQALEQGRLREAHQHCLAILQADQEHADAWFVCGVIAAHNGQAAKAADIFRQAIALSPDNPEYRTELCKQYIALSQYGDALQLAQQTLPLKPTAIPTLNTLGVVFSHVGEHSRALECFALAITKLQQAGRSKQFSTDWQAELNFNFAASLKFAGRFEEAETAYEQAIHLQPRLYKAHSALAQLQRQSLDNNHLQRLQSLRDGASFTSPEDQLHLGHAMAKELEDIGNYSAALASLEWAKREQRRQVQYSAEQDAALFKTVRELFDRERFQSTMAGAACTNAEPIFIVGMPRTGTTLVEQILGGHSQVFAAGELQDFLLQVKRMSGSQSSQVLDIDTLRKSLTVDVASLGEAYIASTRPRTGHSPRFTDKLPLNFMYLGLIKLALPRAKLVCLRRDPMDTCLSNFRQLFANNFRYYHYGYDLLDCGRYYLQFDRLMKHWKDVLPGGLLELDYETLVRKPEETTRQLLAYCELPWEAQCLNFHKRGESVATASAVQVRQPIYQSSVNRWRHYGDAMQPLYELLTFGGCYP